MSYIYSQALVAEYSAANCSDTDASALLSESHTPKPSWWHDKTMEPSRHSRFGMTYAHLTENLGTDLLMWFAADSLARTSVSPEKGPDWTANGQGYGQKWRGLLAKYNHDTHSLKTAQLSLLEDLTGCCATLPRWGLMLDGELYPQPIPELATFEKESGYWPTPEASLGGRGWNRALAERVANGITNRPSGALIGKSLQWEPRFLENYHPGTQLNPSWVEWLMVWPIGMTDLKPLETGRLAEWQQQHGSYYMDEELCQ